jgi:hypothetical protein
MTHLPLMRKELKNIVNLIKNYNLHIPRPEMLDKFSLKFFYFFVLSDTESVFGNI